MLFDTPTNMLFNTNTPTPAEGQIPARSEKGTQMNIEQKEAISADDADRIVDAVLMYAANSDKEIPLSKEALVGFADGLVQAVLTVRKYSVTSS